ncbi:MAG: ribonuclease P protein component [Cyanobacteria bacterium]|nr:ribonuclease P protein component [Cyanobacteria bacterium bin.51]
MALPPDLRLRGYRAFDLLYRRGRRFHGSWMVLRTLEAEEALLSTGSAFAKVSPCRGAVVVSTKVSKRSVCRNRLRRLIHGWMQNHCRVLPEHLSDHWLLFSLKPGSAEAAEELLLGECALLFQKAGLSQ